VRLKLGFALPAAMMLCGSVPSHADFKYTESSKMTGGAVMGAMKFAGVFSKQARDANGAQISTRAVKGNRLREENADGTVQVIDLDGKRFIKIDPKAKTYTILTFEQMKQQMLAAQERMKAEQAKQTGDGKPKANLKLTPKIESSETGATRSLLGLNTKEMKIRIEMLMETDDPKAQGQQISSVMDTDSWIAPAVPGYDELKQFYIKMAKQMDWVPGTVMGGLANSNVQVSMAELKKNNAKIDGIPLLQTVSMSLGGSAMATAPTNPQSAAPAQAPPPPPATQTQEPPSAKDAIAQGIAGHFGLGGFGKKKKKTDDAPAAEAPPANGAAGAATSAPAPAPAPATPGSLMEMTVEVTAYSADTLDQSLFDVPAGYAQVQPDPERKTARP
jgi:hypothetical protein